MSADQPMQRLVPRDAASPGEGGPSSGRYRADLDGLRALAVTAVVLFHYGFGVTGGFVGVDVFFVISGFLITAIIWRDGERGTFSLASFYERRLRRILPALSGMLLVCGVAFFFVFLPEDMRLLAKSEATAAIFATNILFETVAGDYFDADNLSLQPLLHTWSLAIEAQFYLLYPWFLVVLRGRLRLAIALMACAATLSFALCVRGTAVQPIVTFYLLPGRAWELLIGGLLALTEAHVGAERSRPSGPAAAESPSAAGSGPPSKPWAVPRLPELATAAGLTAIVAAAVTFGAATPFPGSAALLPCLGAVLVIAAGRYPNVMSAWLGARPFAALGRISYSVYLWHWPVLVLASYGASAPLPPLTRLSMTAGTLVLAILSYAAIERPFITRAALPGRRAFLAVALAAILATGALGGILDLTGRGVLPFARLPPAVLGFANGHFDRSEGDCDPPGRADAPLPSCRFGDPDAAPTVAVWGNSYARMWTPALDRAARRRGLSGVDLLLGKCPPIVGLSIAIRPTCAGFNRGALAYLREHVGLRTVLLGADWFNDGADLGRLAGTLDALAQAGITAVVLLAPPQADHSVPRTLALAALRGEPPPPPISRDKARAAQSQSLAIIAGLRQRYGFAVIDPATVLCDATQCPEQRDGRAVFYDAGHVTASTAQASADLFDPLFDIAATAPPR